MLALLVALHALCLTLAVVASPAPGRIPKVYNALITSNQNLESSKAYPVYQPVLHDPYFSYQPVYYQPDFPAFPQAPRNGLPPQGPPGSAIDNIPNEVQSSPDEQQPQQPQQQPQPPQQQPQPPQEQPQPPQQQPQPQPQDPNNGNKQPEGAPPLPPSTQSPIPVNQFGLPPQVIPLGRIDPAYDGFTHISQAPQVSSFHYTYPGFRFYDPYDPFLNPYYNLPPLYRPLPNSLGPGSFLPPRPQPPLAAAPSSSPPSDHTDQTPQTSAATPPPEPDNLDVLNYASKDPSIPNVPPPPLPEGGLKTNSS